MIAKLNSTDQLHYRLRCSLCSALIEDDGSVLSCCECPGPSLLKAEYSGLFTIDSEQTGLFRYRQWLPVRRILDDAPRPVTFQSGPLSNLTGLKNLWFTFSGYWPERHALMPTCSFKDLEAFCVLARLAHNEKRVLTVASAGNTAAAFAYVCSRLRTPCLIIVPAAAMAKLSFREKLQPCVRVIAITDDANYMDAMDAAAYITSNSSAFLLEGGARNIARRAGLSTVFLDLYEITNRIPDYYLQAIGSGAGAIATHEVVSRLLQGRSGYARLFLSQNSPFAPVADRWNSAAKEWPDLNTSDIREAIPQMGAPVLANARPPYSLPGGLFDSLYESGGAVVAMSNDQLTEAAAIFLKTEGVDLDPAAAVALASLFAYTERGMISPSSLVSVNLSGGGAERHANDYLLVAHVPNYTCTLADIKSADFIALLQQDIDRCGL